MKWRVVTRAFIFISLNSSLCATDRKVSFSITSESCRIEELSLLVIIALFWILFCLQTETELGSRPFEELRSRQVFSGLHVGAHVSGNESSFRGTLTYNHRESKGRYIQVVLKICLSSNSFRATSRSWEMSRYAVWDVGP